jgi:Glycosyltransferase like family 2
LLLVCTVYRSPNSFRTLDPRICFIGALHTGRANALRAAIWRCVNSFSSLREATPTRRFANGKASPTVGFPDHEGTARQATDRPYLAWVDSDDLLAPDALAATVNILDRHPKVGMVYTNHSIIDEQGRVLGIGARCKTPYSKERLLIDFMTFHFRLMRREIYEAVGGIDLDFPQAQDYDICLKISEVTEIYHHPQSLYYYRSHSDTISQSQRSKQTERAATAVRNALKRRGLSDRYRLDISNGDRFKIVSQV